MPLLSFSAAPTKGAASTVTLDKASLLALSEIASDPYWSDADNIKTAVVCYQSSVGKQDKILSFDFTQATPTATLTLSSKARDSFLVKTILLKDFDGGDIVIDRSQFSAGTLTTLSSFDLNLAGGGGGGGGGAYQTAVLADSPYLFYRLQETSGTVISDSSGNNRDATLTLGSGALDQAGPGSSKSIAFDGSATKIVSNATHAFSTPFSMECWFKTSLSQSAALMSHHATAGSPGWTPELNMNNVAPGGVIESYVFYNSAQLLDPTGGWNDGEWHHVVLTVGPTNNHSIYIDGTLAVSGGNANHGLYDFSWVIGQSSGRAPLSSSYFQGNIAEVAVYETELSAARVLAHYNAGI